MPKSIKVVVVGQGYVGLPLSMAACAAGHFVVGIDVSQHQIETLASGKSPIEDIDSATVIHEIRSGNYLPTLDYGESTDFDVAVITVPTPLRLGAPDLSFIESAGKGLSRYVSHGCLVVLESTTYPGTTEELLAPILERESGLKVGEDFFLGYSPERIDPGNSHWNLLNTPKVVSGVNADSLRAANHFYESLGITTVQVSGTREAEMTKLIENTFRHVNVALVNELAKFSGGLGVNIWEAIEAASTKPFGFMKFTPGPGVGGHCLPIDPSYLSWAIEGKYGTDFRFVTLANEVNQSMPSYVLSRCKEIIEGAGGDLASAQIVLLGLSYKGGSGDTRESPAVKLAELLCESGAGVYAVDPYVQRSAWPVNVKELTKDTLARFDLAILLTDHPIECYSQAIEISERVLDTRNVLRGIDVYRI